MWSVEKEQESIFFKPKNRSLNVVSKDESQSQMGGSAFDQQSQITEEKASKSKKITQDTDGSSLGKRKALQ
jgi:hypothetical protein